MIEQSLVTYLKTQSAVTDLIGTSPMRFHPSTDTSNPTYPLIVYRKISAEREHDLDGARGTAKSRYQMDVLADTYTSAKSVAEALRKSLDGYTTQEFLSVKLENELEGFDQDTDTQRITMDFIIYHTEAL